jgi:hypothetical protein
MGGNVGNPFAAVVDATAVAQVSEILVTAASGRLFHAGQ